MRPSSLLKLQIGPVQDFIAQARSTRDLWSGSYLLSWLVAAGIRRLQEQGGKLIFPNPEGQPLLDPRFGSQEADKLLTPNLPNIFIADVPGDGVAVAKEVEQAICAEWKGIAQAVWNCRAKIALPDSALARFQAQVDRHLSISWQVTEVTTDYATAYKHNGWHLDAVRQTRDFEAWISGSGMNEKDSLSGKEEALIAGDDIKGEWEFLFKHADYLGAVAVIKRCWHLAYLKAKHGLKTDSREFPIRSIPAIAARSTKLDDLEEVQVKTSGDKYIAAIAFDGDSIGKWVNGDFLPDKCKLAQHHSDFSRDLSLFALSEVRQIVEREVDGKDDSGQPSRVPLGQLIYAGGDDVVCLVPADVALDVAHQLRKAFRTATGNTASTGPEPDASAGIAIAHIHSPLQDLIREAQKAEKRAKNDGPRPAFSITLMKRSGEISHWTSQWESGAIPLHRAIFAAMQEGELSAKFPHRLIELLDAYLTQTTGLSSQKDAPGFDAREIITREFTHAATRQGSMEVATRLAPILDEFLGKLEGRTHQQRLSTLIQLATTLAFTFRNIPKIQPAERQPVP